jgi:hypothetical protein
MEMEAAGGAVLFEVGRRLPKLNGHVVFFLPDLHYHEDSEDAGGASPANVAPPGPRSRQQQNFLACRDTAEQKFRFSWRSGMDLPTPRTVGYLREKDRELDP